MLYWNEFGSRLYVLRDRVEPKQMLYWNVVGIDLKNGLIMSNRNKCCIEILKTKWTPKWTPSRTETNVVLKCCSLFLALNGERRTETNVVLKYSFMGCIDERNWCRTETNVVLKFAYYSSFSFWLRVEPKQMLYWNVISLALRFGSSTVEPKQMLYWNCLYGWKDGAAHLVEPKQMLYWNYLKEIMEELSPQSNRNKCCIEMFQLCLYQLYQ